MPDHWHKSTENEAAGMAADLEHDHADGEEWCEVGVTWGGSRSEVKYRRVRGQTTVATPWRCGPSTTFTNSTKMETISSSLLQEEYKQLIFQLDYQMLPLSMEK